MDLSIVTVTYRSVDFIADCILSVVCHTLNIKYEHIIVDNGSQDGTVELIEEGYLNYVRLIKNDRNLGFAAANKLGVEVAKGRYLLFLNPDMQIHEGYLDVLVAWMEKHPLVGIASCKLLNFLEKAHPVLRPMKFPSLFPYFSMFIYPKPFFCTVHHKFYYESFQDDVEQEVEIVRGSFMIMPREIIDKTGFAFDPRYFLLLEDVDICKHVKKLGYKVVYTPIITAIDLLGQSFLTKSTAWKYLQMTRSLKIYVSKWHSKWHLIWLHFFIPIGFILRIPIWGIKNSWGAFRKEV